MIRVIIAAGVHHQRLALNFTDFFQPRRQHRVVRHVGVVVQHAAVADDDVVLAAGGALGAGLLTVSYAAQYRYFERTLPGVLEELARNIALPHGRRAPNRFA